MKTSRPQSFVGTLLLIGVLLLAACAGPESVSEQPAASVPAPESAAAQASEVPISDRGFRESPMLAALVAAGELPSIDERLPETPLIVEPAHSIGRHGGDFVETITYELNMRFWGYEGLVRWSVDGSEVIPNIAESFEVSADATEYTFYLRPGMRWSDGAPFTADDILFWWEEVETEPEINPTGPNNTYMAGGEPAEVIKVDDYTVTFRFVVPYGLFLQNLSGPSGMRATMFPRHYMEQFDRDYNPDGVADMMAAANETEWGRWWKANVGTYGDDAQWNDPDRPMHLPWILTSPYRGSQQLIAERNPYYFKVDPEGNQLPYIDRRVMTIVADDEVMLLNALNGEDMFPKRYVSTTANKALFFDNQETGNFRFIDAVNSDLNTAMIRLNLNHADDVKREVFQNRDFRVGLSYAIDRQSIINAVYAAQGEPFQVSPRPESPFYHEQLARQYTEFSPELANQHLDQALPERDGEGYRLGPDGQRFSFMIMVNTDFRPEWGDLMELVQANWQSVGIDAQINLVGDSLWRARDIETVDGTIWAGENGLGMLPLLSPGIYGPSDAPAWSNWNVRQINPDATVNMEPQEPPASVQRQYELMRALPQAANAEEQAAVIGEILDIAAEDFYVIGISLPAGDYRVVSNRLHNVPDPVLLGWLYPGPAPSNWETFYLID